MYRSEVYGKGGIYAKVVAASVANDIPIYTIETRAPKFIDAEFEKHRMLSSNSSSSRAIPFKELEDIYLPFDLRKKESGMQGHERLSDYDTALFGGFISGIYGDIIGYFKRRDGWQTIIHKQHLNRYIEAWMFQKKVVTATEWDNFFNLRLHPAAQPEIQELARCMKEAMELAEPIKLRLGEWHLPYINIDETNDVFDGDTWQYPELCLDEQIKCSVARCARVSYLNHDKSDPNIEKDLALADKLLNDGHMTPFEHQATPMKYTECDVYYDHYDNSRTITGDWESGITHVDKDDNYWSANFRGWIQNRQIL